MRQGTGRQDTIGFVRFTLMECLRPVTVAPAEIGRFRVSPTQVLIAIFRLPLPFFLLLLVFSLSTQRQ